MKKYRLIKYDVTGRRIEHGTESFPTLEEAAKQMLERTEITYRIEEFEESIMDRVKSYEDGCEIDRNVAVELLIDYLEKNFSTHFTAHIIALLKLETITAALNEGWRPDFEDDKQEMWYVYHEGVNKLKVDSCCDWGLMPSRLYFKSRELAEYAAKQFAELYKQLLIETF